MKVVIVGGGVIGCAAAYELASRGADVLVCDPRGIGQGATRASAGMLAPYIEAHAGAMLRLGVSGLACYGGFVDRVVADARLPVEYHRNGTLQVALDEDEAAALRQRADTLRREGARTEWLGAAQVRAAEPSLDSRACAGLLIQEHGYVHVGSFADALAAAARRHGARMITARALSLRGGAQARPVAIETSEGRIEADAAVVAAGSWAPCIGLPPAAIPVRPVRGQLVQLETPRRTLSHIVWGAGGYVVPWDNGSVLVGATVEDAGFDERVTAAGVRDLLTAGQRLVPGLRDARFDGARAGLRPLTPDELPIVGASTESQGVYLATGHYRNGVLLAPLTALMIADLLVDGRARPELELVRPARFGL